MAPQQPSWKQEARPEPQTEPAQETETKPGPEAAPPSETPGENQ
jgi:hypothetical protein